MTSLGAAIVAFNLTPGDFWAMTLKEWFAILKYKMDANAAEREALDNIKSGKAKVPAKVWRELRQDMKDGKAGLILHGR